MAKQRMLATRAYGAEPGLPDAAGLAGWVAEHRGMAADLTTYLLEASLSPQVSAGIGTPCAGGKFYAGRIRQCISGIHEYRAVGEIHADTSPITDDAAGIVVQQKGAWCALPAPHLLGIRNTHYGDPDEWNEAIAGVYRTVMRAMRDTGIPGNVLIGERMISGELAALARQKVFFFAPAPQRTDLENLLEYQHQVAVTKEQLVTVINLLDEYTVRKIVIINPDPASICLALSRFDADQIAAGGYCTEQCGEYWQDLRSSAAYPA